MDSLDRTPERVRSAAELARLLGVSPAAVSYALRGQRGVSDALRAVILEAAKAHGLATPQPMAQDRGVLGVILADVANPFYSELAISLTDAAREEGYEVFLSNSHDEQRAVSAAVEAMVKRRVDGVLLTAIQSGNADVFRVLRAAKTPFVQISRRMVHADADFVGVDDHAAATEVMNHVIGHGFQRIAIVAGPPTSTASARRAQGYRDALRAKGLGLEQAWNITGGLNETDGARAAHHLLSLKQLPQAVVCGTDSIALGLISVLATRNIQVPRDLAVAGFDGLTTARTHLADLTTIVQPRGRMAAEAVAMITTRREHLHMPARAVICSHHLYIGKSCGCHRRKEETP